MLAPICIFPGFSLLSVAAFWLSEPWQSGLLLVGLSAMASSLVLLWRALQAARTRRYYARLIIVAAPTWCIGQPSLEPVLAVLTVLQGLGKSSLPLV